MAGTNLESECINIINVAMYRMTSFKHQIFYMLRYKIFKYLQILIHTIAANI